MSFCGEIIDYILLFEPNGAFVVTKVKSLYTLLGSNHNCQQDMRQQS